MQDNKKNIVSIKKQLIHEISAIVLISLVCLLIYCNITKPYIPIGKGFVPFVDKDVITKSYGVMNEALTDGNAILLNDGRVLIIEASKGHAEIFDPKTAIFSRTSNTQYKRWTHEYTATLLTDGRVLITGGRAIDTATPNPPPEIYNPKTNKFKTISPMNLFRSEHTATLLKNGKVLIAGGFVGLKGKACYYSKPQNCDQNIMRAELFDPITEKFTFTGKMVYPRNRHAAVLLDDGKVLISGGGLMFEHDEGDYSSKAEIYDPNTKKFTRTGDMNINRGYLKLALMKNGKVLVSSGSNLYNRPTGPLEVYDPKKETFKQSYNLGNKKSFVTTPLPNGNVLITGGYKGITTSFDDIGIYDPEKETYSYIGKMIRKRAGHNATVLKDKSILITGGSKFKDAELLKIK